MQQNPNKTKDNTLGAQSKAGMEKSGKTATEFEEQKKDSLLDLDLDLTLNDSTELWLLQWPFNQPPDFDGQDVTLKLHHNGELGSFQGSSGKSYEVVSFKSHDPEEMVFLSSASGSKIVGKISRRVSLVHYPEPDDFQKQDKVAARLMAQRTSATSMTNSARRTATPTQTIRPRNFQASTGTASTPSSRNRSSRSSISGAFEPLKSPKRRRVDEPTSSIGGRADRDSGKGHSTVTSTGSFDQSQERKSKNKKKNEG